MSTPQSTPAVIHRPLVQSNGVEAAQERAPTSQINTWDRRRPADLVKIVLREQQKPQVIVYSMFELRG